MFSWLRRQGCGLVFYAFVFHFRYRQCMFILFSRFWETQWLMQTILWILLATPWHLAWTTIVLAWILLSLLGNNSSFPQRAHPTSSICSKACTDVQIIQGEEDMRAGKNFDCTAEIMHYSITFWSVSVALLSLENTLVWCRFLVCMRSFPFSISSIFIDCVALYVKYFQPFNVGLWNISCFCVLFS